ncbi:hypothetical protein MOSE0_A02960 [Monosporozyma servazzii]
MISQERRLKKTIPREEAQEDYPTRGSSRRLSHERKLRKTIQERKLKKTIPREEHQI